MSSFTNIANSQLGSRRVPWHDVWASVRKGKKVAEVKRLNQEIRSAALIAHRRRCWALSPAPRDDGQDEFDAGAWMAVVEEQKLAIAQAAGVDPSKVRIRIGH